MNSCEIKDLDIVVPISIDLDWITADTAVKDILEQQKNYGINKFMLACPSGGWRAIGYPPREKFIELANMFVEIKKKLAPYGVELGWWNTLTVKSGQNADFSGVIKSDGTKHPFGNCPLDENFKKRFSRDIALFAKIAEPTLIIFEDDYSLGATDGCYCEKHLNEFAKRQGRFYSREEIVESANGKQTEDIELIRAWRNLLKDSLVGLAESVRKELDKETPHIPAGIMQSGACDFDGDTVEAIARALAGDKHTPFARLFGAFYHTFKTKDIPELLYHSLYNKQHIGENFFHYFETDTYPHTKFFTAAAHIKSMMATVYSYGFDGSTFQTQQLLDCANEEDIYGKMWKREKNRFNAVHRVAKQCDLKGAEIKYDPFWNTTAYVANQGYSEWIKVLSRFGVPYVTTDSSVAFWDKRRAKYADENEIKSALSKTLFLEGDAAKVLFDRGFGEYLGIEIGGDVLEGNNLIYDLAVREVICDKFTYNGKGKNMPSAHMYNPLGNGRMLKITPTDEKCEVLTEYYNYGKERISASMTRFENSLGGKVVVMGLTLYRNNSHALYNYRRKRLLNDMLVWAECDFAFVKEAPETFIVDNRAKNPESSGFKAMLTLINYCEDELDTVSIYLPEDLRNFSKISVLSESGEWQDMNFTTTPDGIEIKEKLSHLTPIYILIA